MATSKGRNWTLLDKEKASQRPKIHLNLLNQKIHEIMNEMRMELKTLSSKALRTSNDVGYLDKSFLKKYKSV